MNIRNATMEDLDEITALEANCFPIEEAATRKALKDRLEKYPNHFWLLVDNNKIISMVNGLVTDIPKLCDEMYDDTGFHNEDGDWQMIFGVDTLPEYQNRGNAATLLNAVIRDAREYGRKGLVLTCKEGLKHYYEKFGFVDEGVSLSTHGGAVWYDMRLSFT